MLNNYENELIFSSAVSRKISSSSLSSLSKKPTETIEKCIENDPISAPEAAAIPFKDLVSCFVYFVLLESFN